jgi:hypothetical protein
VWGSIPFVCECPALARPESVLFIDYYIREVLELYRFLDERVRADDHSDFTIRHPLEKLCP